MRRVTRPANSPAYEDALWKLNNALVDSMNHRCWKCDWLWTCAESKRLHAAFEEADREYRRAYGLEDK